MGSRAGDGAGRGGGVGDAAAVGLAAASVAQRALVQFRCDVAGASASPSSVKANAAVRPRPMVAVLMKTSVIAGWWRRESAIGLVRAGQRQRKKIAYTPPGATTSLRKLSQSSCDTPPSAPKHCRQRCSGRSLQAQGRHFSPAKGDGFLADQAGGVVAGRGAADPAAQVAARDDLAHRDGGGGVGRRGGGTGFAGSQVAVHHRAVGARSTARRQPRPPAGPSRTSGAHPGALLAPTSGPCRLRAFRGGVGGHCRSGSGVGQLQVHHAGAAGRTGQHQHHQAGSPETADALLAAPGPQPAGVLGARLPAG